MGTLSLEAAAARCRAGGRKEKAKESQLPNTAANDMREKGRRKKGRTWAEAARTVRGALRLEGGGPAGRGGGGGG